MTAAGAASTKGPLTGISVVVTRPEGDDDALADALRAAGASVVAAPAITIADPDDGGAALAAAVAHLEHFRWVAFTSANAVRRVLSLVPDPRAFAGTSIAAVGDATADVLANRHLVADLVADPPDAEGLAESFPAVDIPGAAVLFPAAAGARPTLRAGLAAKGWAVTQVVAYRTVAAPSPPPEAAAAIAGATAVTFASPSAVRAYLSWRTTSGDPVPVPPVVACIGPVTADAARALGVRVSAVAREPSAGALAGALVGALAGAPAAPASGA